MTDKQVLTPATRVAVASLAIAYHSFMSCDAEAKPHQSILWAQHLMHLQDKLDVFMISKADLEKHIRIVERHIAAQQAQ